MNYQLMFQTAAWGSGATWFLSIFVLMYFSDIKPRNLGTFRVALFVNFVLFILMAVFTLAAGLS